MPHLSYRAITKKLKKLGFVFHREGKGSHEFWIHPEKGTIIMLAKHTKGISIGAATDIAKDCGFKTLKDFENFN